MLPLKYISKNVRISQSSSHEDMFIVEFGDGTFYSIHSSLQAIQHMHPPDGSQFVRNYKQFMRTSNYIPTNADFQSFTKIARNHSKQTKS